MEYILRNADFPKDYLEIYKMFVKENKPVFMPQKRNFLNIEDFSHWLSEQLSGYIHDLYLIETISETGKWQISGYCLSYDYRRYDSHCQIYGYHNHGITADMLKHFISILFKEYPLNKIFLQIADIEKTLLSAAIETGFQEEVRLSHSKYINGSYHDFIILGYYAETFFRKMTGDRQTLIYEEQLHQE